jgi:RNA-dependent RNA polymerase
MPEEKLTRTTGLQLAELHSTAVDYVKTGVPAQWNKTLDPRKYPHFMEKAKHKTYRSTSVLGKLYDMVDKEVFDSRENYTLPFDDRILKRFPPDHAMLKEARKLKTQYDIAMRRIMGQLEIRTEFEVWTTFVMSKPRVGTDYKVQEKVGREAAGLKKQFRDLCIKVAEEQNFDRLEFVASMYRVTWEETRIALYEARQPHVRLDGSVGRRRVTARSMPLISFPWLFPEDLGRVALGAEKLPLFAEVGIRSNPRSTQTPKLKEGNRAGRLETELDLAGMDYTKTSDGQFIHRGEILHLFRHDEEGEGEEGFYCDDAAPESPVDSDVVQEAEKSLSDVSGDVPLLLDLGTASDEEGVSSGSGSISPTHEPAPMNGMVPSLFKDLATLDLLSSDTDGTDSSPCLTPIKTSFAKQQDSTTAAVTRFNGSAKISIPAHLQVDVPSSNESVTSDSTSTWDRVTTPGLESSSSEDLSPVEYITLPSLSVNSWGVRFGARIGASELWGHQSTTGSGASGSINGLNGNKSQGWNRDLNGESRMGSVTTSDLFALDKSEETAESDGEIEYREEIIEVDGETALERAARFG